MQDLVHVVRENTLLVLSAGKKKLSPVLAQESMYSPIRWSARESEVSEFGLEAYWSKRKHLSLRALACLLNDPTQQRT